MTRYGNCSVCQVVHPAPFGSHCKFMADAKAYCKANGIDKVDFMKHTDFAGMPKPIDGDEVAGEDGAPLEGGAATAVGAWTPDVIADLLKINADQKDKWTL